jgi:hypothetical protein
MDDFYRSKIVLRPSKTPSMAGFVRKENYFALGTLFRKIKLKMFTRTSWSLVVCMKFLSRVDRVGLLRLTMQFDVSSSKRRSSLTLLLVAFVLSLEESILR